jgi:phage terminase Nu1 subunit (DNA packaging protein)
MTKGSDHDEMDAETVARLLKVSLRMLRIYVSDKGLPCHGDKRARVFKWGEVLDWYVEYRISIASPDGNRGNETQRHPPANPESALVMDDQPKPVEKYKDALTRKIIAEADLKEIERAIKRREVIAAGDAKRILDRLFTDVKQKLLGLPSKLALRLEGVKNRNQRTAILEAEIRQICQELAVHAVTGAEGQDAAQ